MEIKNLKKRSEVKKHIPASESPMEAELFEVLMSYGLKFQKQFPIGKFYADLALPEIRMVVEYDGKEFHRDTEKDKNRDEYMEKEGWTVLRVSKLAHLFNVSKNGIMIGGGKMKDIAEEIDEIAERRKYQFGVEIRKSGYEESKELKSLGLNNYLNKFQRN